MKLPKTRRETEQALQEARDALADKVQEHRRAILRNKAAGHFEQEIADLRERIEELKQALGITEPEQPIAESPDDPTQLPAEPTDPQTKQ